MGALCVLAAVCTASPAAAQPSDAERTALARTLFDEGVGFVDHDRWSEAVDRFRRAYALRASPVIAFNLASALAEQGHPVESTELLRVVLHDPSTERRVRTAATDLLAAVSPRVA